MKHPLTEKAHTVFIVRIALGGCFSVSCISGKIKLKLNANPIAPSEFSISKVLFAGVEDRPPTI